MLAIRLPAMPPRVIDTRLTSTDNEPSPPLIPHDSKEPGVETGGAIQIRIQPKKEPTMLAYNVSFMRCLIAPTTKPITEPQMAPRMILRRV